MAADDDSTRVSRGLSRPRRGRASRASAPRRGTSAGIKAAFGASPVPTAITRASDGVIVFANVASPADAGLAGGRVRRPHDARGGLLGEPRAAARRCSRSSTAKASSATSSRRSRRAAASGGPCWCRSRMSSSTARTASSATSTTSPSGACSKSGVRESEERFRQVTETFQQGFLLREVDPPAVLYASPAVARIFGVDLARHLPRSPRARRTSCIPTTATRSPRCATR